MAARCIARALVPIALLAAWVWSPLLPAARASSHCAFTLGFAALRDQIGAATVGDCLENERHHPQSGNGEQRTGRGLLVWRKADNRTAFTDGHTTWIGGPDGLVHRLNTERFAWEEPPASGAAPTPSTAAEAGPAVEISGLATGWGPQPDSLRKFPHIRFTITNRSPDALPVYDDRLHYSADFFDPVSRKPFGSGLGVHDQLGMAGLPPAFSTAVEVTSSASVDVVDGAQLPALLTIELYQGNSLAGERRHVGTYQLRSPQPPR